MVAAQATAPGGCGSSSATSGPRWSGSPGPTDGRLELPGSYHEPEGRPAELVLREAERDETFTAPVTRDGDRFSMALRPTAMTTTAGDLPLPEGQWDL